MNDIIIVEVPHSGRVKFWSAINEVVANTYEVTIKGTITKTIVVDAINQDEAEDKAHGMFNVTCDGPEYWQETVGTTKLIKEEV